MRAITQALSRTPACKTVATLFISIGAAAGFAPPPLHAQSEAVPAANLAPVPSLIRFNGTLNDSRGWPITTPVTVTFAIYAQPTGDTPPALWQETEQISPNNKGGYTALLGSATASGIPVGIFHPGESQYLSVQPEGEPEQPRVLLVSVPYALKSGDAATLGGLPASAYALAGTGISPASALAPVVANATVTTPGGIAGYLPEFSAASTIVDSPIFINGADVGIGTASPIATLDVNGATILNGGMTVNGNAIYNGFFILPPSGTATASTGYNSQFFKLEASAYNSVGKSAVTPRFQWEAEATGNNTVSPGATLNLLASTTATPPAETGFYFNPNGTLHFAPGQTFPGAGGGSGTITGVTTTSPLTGGGTSGMVALGLNTASLETTLNSAYAQLNAPNTFKATLTANAGFSIPLGVGTTSPSYDLEVYGANASNAGLAMVSNGTDAAISLNNLNTTNGGLEWWIDSGSNGAGVGAGNFAIYDRTDNVTRLVIDSAGEVGIGTIVPYVLGGQLSVIASSITGDTAIAGQGVYIAQNGGGTAGIAGYGAHTDNSSNQIGGDGGVFIGGNADIAEDSGYGLYVVGGAGATEGSAYAAIFQNDIEVNGTVISDVAGTRIDHPADPAGKYLVHASVQSSEMMNLYTGNVVTDELGLATVKLPGWFEAENADFRYQLTVIGRKAQAWIAEEVSRGEFKIASDATNTKVSWQITAVRQDAYAKAHPLVVEEAKPAREIGFYGHPELYGQRRQRQTEWARNPARMKRLEARRATAEEHQSQSSTGQAAANLITKPN